MVRMLNSKANEKSVHGAIVEFIVEWGAEPLPAHLPPLQWREEVLGRVRKTASRSDHTDINFFAQLESAIDTDLQDADSAIAVQAANALIDAASYYENIGIPDRALTLALRSLDQGKIRENLKVQRRAHSYVGAVYTRLSDFHNACIHMQHAYELAKKIGEITGIFATLANTVAVLESMGLLSAARTLALKVASNQPWGNEKFDSLHLSNASNGMRICHLLEDFENACKFYNLANKAMQSCRGFASEITIAHYEAGRVTYLTAIGKTFEAQQIVNSVLSQNHAKENPRVKSLLICAQAFVHLDLGDLEKIKYSCDQAEALLELTTKLSDHREDLLRVLVKLNTALNRDKSKDYLSQAGVYLRLLRTHSLSIKHQQFFLNAGNDLKNVQLAHEVALENPSYIVPSWITNIDETSSSNFAVRRSTQPRKVLPFDVQELRKEHAETSLRTAAYNVAENWAVAAEYANGGTGQHCFHVGRVAGAIAKTLNFSAEEITRLDLACRLHDIGRVAVAFSKLGISDRRVLGTFSVACEHTLDGARLLLSCMDKTLELAANIARTHHEWWNGCGYPQGLRQDQIPIEGRICAVADFFVCLVCSDIAEPRWTTERALMQIQTMAGMQLDPKLVRQLVQAFEEDETSFFDFCADKTRLDSNELAHSKKALCRSLDLVD